MRIQQLTPAESGWKAVFKEPDGSESISRILGWALLGDDGAIAGVVVDPADPARVVPAAEASSPGGGTFLRYRFVPPEPIVVPAPAPPAVKEDTTEQIAKGLLKRKR